MVLTWLSQVDEGLLIFLILRMLKTCIRHRLFIVLPLPFLLSSYLRKGTILELDLIVVQNIFPYEVIREQP